MRLHRPARRDPEGRSRGFQIREPSRIAALASPARQEIVDGVQALGPCSVAELARLLGRPADALYFHIRLLLRLGLLVEQGSRSTGGRDQTVYDVPARPLRLHYDSGDKANVAAVCRVVGSALRSAERDFRSAFGAGLAITSPARRNIWAGRAKGWLDRASLAAVRAHIESIVQILTRGRPGPGAELHAVTFALSPIATGRWRRDARATRRARRAKSRSSHPDF